MNIINPIPFLSQESPTKPIKPLIFITLILTGFFFSQASLAGCSVTGPYINPILYYYDSEIEIDSSLPMYSTLGDFRIQSTPSTNPLINCTENDPQIIFAPDRLLHSPGIYETGIPGIGMIVRFNGNNIYGAAPSAYQLSGQNFEMPGFLISYITLVKIGHIPSSGQISPGSIIKANIVNYGNLLVWNDILERPLIVNLLRPTCAVNTPNFTVDLRDVSMVDFNTAGRTLPKNFSIDLTCTGGTNSADVYVTLTDANNPANATSQLGLSPDSTAEGIALEVNNRFGAVNFGPDLEGLGNPGQWNDGSTGIGSYSIPLSVNYVRLPGPIKGGTANSGVTYTLNYD